MSRIEDENNIFYPMVLTSVAKDSYWGGTKLKDRFNIKTDLPRVAEAWVCSTNPAGLSFIQNGPFSGMSLLEVIKKHPELLGTKNSESGDLPIMVKIADVNENRSVQVHPSDEQALSAGGQRGKTEFWYILETTDEAKIAYGFEHKVTKRTLERAIKTNTLEKHLHYIHPNPKDGYLIPAGLAHALNKGIVLVEVQQSSDVAYRFYDYGRKDEGGETRPLEIEKAIKTLNLDVAVERVSQNRLINYYPGHARKELARCQYFEVEVMRTICELSFSVLDRSFQVFLCIEGSGQIECENGGKPIEFAKGNCIFLPANLGRCRVSGVCKALKIRC